MLTVGRFAHLAGVSAKVLRTYDALGVFRPAWVDASSSYRYYSPAQLPELRRILALRDMGLGLADVRDLAAGGDLHSALARRRAQLEDERRELERRLKALDITVQMAARTEQGPDAVVRSIPAEPVAVLPMRDDEDDGAAFYELESYVRDLGRRAHRPPGALVPITGPGPVEIFVPVRGSIPGQGRISYRRLPAIRAATVMQRGPYRGLAAARRRLEHWMERTGLAPGSPVRILYLQFGAETELAVPAGYVVDRPADYLTELQVPVEPPRARGITSAGDAPGSGPSCGSRRSDRPR